MDILILVCAVLLLGFLCVKGVPTLVSGVACSVLILLAFGMNIYSGLLDTYMTGFVSFVKSWFIMFFLGALFGQVLEKSGAADSLARAVLKLVGEKRISLGVFIIAALFCACGISVYITLFIVLPIGIKICRQANLSRGVIIAGYTLGINTGLALPYVPVANNLLCGQYFGTEAGAGGALGIVVSIIYAAVGLLYINWYEKRCAARGIGYEAGAGEVAELDENKALPHWPLALIPLCIPIVALNLLKVKVEVALLLGIVVAIICQFKYLPKNFGFANKMITDSISTTTFTIVNTSAIVGFGAVIQASPGYAVAVEQILDISVHPLWVGYIAINSIAAIAGASSAGIVLAAPVLQEMLPLVNADVFHRTIVLSSLGLDDLPNAGFLHTECALAGVKFKDVYLPIIFVISVVLSLLRAPLYILICIALGIA